MIHIYNEILFSLKRKEMLTHTATWVTFEDIMPSEISKSQQFKRMPEWSAHHRSTRGNVKAKYTEWTSRPAQSSPDS